MINLNDSNWITQEQLSRWKNSTCWSEIRTPKSDQASWIELWERRRGEKRAYVDIIADGGDLLRGLLAEPVGARLVQNLIHAVSLCFLFSATATATCFGSRWEEPIQIVEISRARKGTGGRDFLILRNYLPPLVLVRSILIWGIRKLGKLPLFNYADSDRCAMLEASTTILIHTFPHSCWHARSFLLIARRVVQEQSVPFASSSRWIRSDPNILYPNFLHPKNVHTCTVTCTPPKYVRFPTLITPCRLDRNKRVIHTYTTFSNWIEC